jgi:Zn-dependent protease
MSFGFLPLLENPLAFLVAFAAAAFGLVMHNVAQAWLADRYKDNQPRRFGFLSLEPRVHLDILGIAFLLLLGFGFPRPVPFRLIRNKEAAVALMGPLGMLGMAFIYIVLSRLLGSVGPATAGIASGLAFAGSVMISHAVVFLFPVPPLDGARVVYALGGPEARRFMDQLQGYGPMGFFLIFLLLSLTGILGAARTGIAGAINALLSAIGL